MKLYSMLSKAFLKSKNKAMPGILSASVHTIMSGIIRTFCAIDQPLMKLVRSPFSRGGKTFEILAAIALVAIL